MKISEVKAKTDIIAAHCNASPDDELLQVYWDAAVKKVLSDTGLDEAAADQYDDLTVAALALTAEMYYNRGAHIDNDKLNRVVDSFLGSHDFNLLPGEAKT